VTRINTKRQQKGVGIETGGQHPYGRSCNRKVYPGTGTRPHETKKMARDGK
jgi:hypothetical protein